jgi:hypothetical protein
MTALTESDDLALVAAANRGDPASFEAIYFRYRDWVTRLAYRFTGSRDLALDVLQETFILTGLTAGQEVSPPSSTRAAVEAPPVDPAAFFVTVPVFIDSKDQPLAAYQFEFTAETGDVKIVGVEGGEHPAFKDAPYYDPAALQKGRIIIAAFNTGKDLPKGRTRVSTIHLAVSGSSRPTYAATLIVAATPDGKPLSCNISWIVKNR